MMGLAAIGITIFLSMFGFWWRVESRQDKKIDGLRNFNDKDHREICKEILAATELDAVTYHECHNIFGHQNCLNGAQRTG